MMQRPQSSLIALICLGLAACATSSRNAVPKAPIKVPTSAPVVIGRVSLVNEELEFALIETRAAPETGTLLQTRSAEGVETARLKVSLEKRPPFVIADVLKGKPHVGEVVVK